VTVPTLELREVRVTVADGDDTLTILDGASLAVEPGELVMVQGRSGSGKSTLLAVAGLLRRPTAGEVLVEGRPTSALTNRARTVLRRDRLAIVHQSAQLFPSLRAVEQLELVAHVAGQLDRAARQRARDLLGEVGLGDRLRHLPAHLSGGERQRVGLARALMREPGILLADEPTASLDAARSREMVELLARETEQRRLATVVVTHEAAHLDLAGRTVELVDGRLQPIATTVA
jgi:putative ABC transport system ATP-binding protein